MPIATATTTIKRPVKRPAKTAPEPAAKARRASAKQAGEPAAKVAKATPKTSVGAESTEKPAKRNGRTNRRGELNPLTGYRVGTFSDIVIEEALLGGESANEVLTRARATAEKRGLAIAENSAKTRFYEAVKVAVLQGFVKETMFILHPPKLKGRAAKTA